MLKRHTCEPGEMETVVATWGLPVQMPLLSRLYELAIRGMSDPDHLQLEEIQKICFVFATQCIKSGVALPSA